MKKIKANLLSILVLIILLLVSVMLLSACGGENGGETTPPEPNLRTLLVTQYDVAESQEWSFEQFVEHADSEISYTLVEMPISALIVYIPYVYTRILNMDTNKVSHERVHMGALQRVENPESPISLNSRGRIGRPSAVTTINELVIVYYRPHPNHGTITFHVIHNLPN
ncbi:MAG: hypothetical protein FWC80_07350 [Firmicutes bacterium]|nr:hypothetical protein [Bacillota bacterium]